MSCALFVDDQIVRDVLNAGCVPGKVDALARCLLPGNRRQLVGDAAGADAIRMRRTWSVALIRGPLPYRGLHWNVMVLVPFALVTMLEITCCDPLFMQ